MSPFCTNFHQRTLAGITSRSCDGSVYSPIPATEVPQVDLSLLNQQMLRLVRGSACILFFTICWGIWGQVLPALQVFSRIEIFANFVSGLIILFERPVRIGDVVTIDSVTGCVSRIQIRATTITDWDRKEYIVPNKEFVTGKLLNWTLSDKTNRIVVRIGVAYGTDTENALSMLQQIADEHPLILRDPPPVVGFEGFGESSPDLVLRCFLPSLDNRRKVITQLHVMIDRRFKEAGLDGGTIADSQLATVFTKIGRSP